MSNIIHILENFKVNTEAQATNQGFFYQYLVTLDIWLDNYNSKKDVTIYCETEDDIKIEDSKNNKIEFTQVKAYTKNFTINSEEVKKSIVNFFYLYVIYKYGKKKKTPTFIFKTTSSYEKVLSDYVENNLYQRTINKEVKALLTKNFKKQNTKKITTLNDNIKNLEKKITTLQQNKRIQEKKDDIKSSKKEKNELGKELKDLIEFMKDNSLDFIKTIQWESEKKDKETVIEELIKSIKSKISEIPNFKFDVDSAYGRLIEKVLYASQASEIKDRKLDNQMINNLIQEAEDVENFKEGLQYVKLLPKFIELCEYHKIQIGLSKIILKEIQEHRQETKIGFQEIKDRLDKVLPPNIMSSIVKTT